MSEGWIDNLPLVNKIDELLELMRVGPTADDLHKTHDLIGWLTLAIGALVLVLLFRGKS